MVAEPPDLGGLYFATKVALALSLFPGCDLRWPQPYEQKSIYVILLNLHYNHAELYGTQLPLCGQ